MLRLVTGRASFWLRGIATGGIVAVVCTIAVGLVIASARDEQPFRRGKHVPSGVIDITAEIAVPIAAAAGAFVGCGLAECLWRAKRERRHPRTDYAASHHEGER